MMVDSQAIKTKRKKLILYQLKKLSSLCQQNSQETNKQNFFVVVVNSSGLIVVTIEGIPSKCKIDSYVTFIPLSSCFDVCESPVFFRLLITLS